MIEVTILNHLKSKMNVFVGLEKPEPLLAEYVLLEKIRSNRNNHLHSSTFAFQSYSTSLYKASQLNELTKQAVDSLIELNEIAGIQLNTDYNYTDTTTKQYRYQAIYDIRHY